MNIIVYSTPICPWCMKVKNWLKDHNIDFKEVNVMEDQEAAKHMIEKSGQMGVPVTEIDGQMIVGFNEAKLKELLKIND